MCVIVGYIGHRPASDVLVDGLKRLEYRGYDSNGLAILDSGELHLRRSVGKIVNLEKILKKRPLKGWIGLGHTRWATHGIPSEENAHPHTDCSGNIVVVHNGIIENYADIKSKLAKKNHKFASQTDTEVIVHLIEEEWKNTKKKLNKFSSVSRNGHGIEKEFLQTLLNALSHIEGAYALGVVCTELPGILFAAKKDCPLVLGVGPNESFLASDVPALIPFTRETIFMDQNEVAVLKQKKIDCYTLDGKPINKSPVKIKWNPIQAEKSGYKYFMLKEIMEQPIALQDSMRGRLFTGAKGMKIDLTMKDSYITKIKKIKLIACGTSYHAALVGQYWFEQIAKIPCQVEIASEYRYRTSFSEKGNLSIFISQSGETADTIAALRLAKTTGTKTLSICNVLGSTITSLADSTFYTHCGPEIGVASTKAFTGQLTALLTLAIYFGGLRKSVEHKMFRGLVRNLLKVPGWVRESLSVSKHVEKIAAKLYKKNSFLYLGRNLNYPLALEGALKLKEISYIHAEGYPAGEMKHGPIALVDKNMPIVAIATHANVYEKTCSNIEEAKARGATVIAVASQGDKKINKIADHTIYVPSIPEMYSPIINAIPLQFLAYFVADLRGCDVDQPRNLAKSVTVE